MAELEAASESAPASEAVTAPAAAADHATAMHNAAEHGFGVQPFGHMMRHVGSSTAEVWDAVVAMLQDARRAPGMAPQAATLLTNNGDSGSVAWVLFCLFAVMFAAILVGAIVHRLLRGERRRLAQVSVDRASRGVLLGLEALVVDLLPPAAYLLSCGPLYFLCFSARGILFPASDVAQGFINALMQSSAFGWAAFIVLVQPFAPDRPGLRLVPLSNANARNARTIFETR